MRPSALRVGVLTAVHEDQEGLDRTLSTLPRDLPTTVVVVDDGSATPMVVPEELGCHRVWRIRLDENVGQHRARNVGLERLIDEDFDYVAILDAGDRALHARFSKQAAFLDERDEVAAVGSYVDAISEDGRRIIPLRPPTNTTRLARAMHLRNQLPHSSVMMRLEAVSRCGLYRPRMTEDYDLLMRLREVGDLACLDEVLTHYQMNEQGLSHARARAQVADALRIQLERFDIGLWESYGGVALTCARLIVPRRLAERSYARFVARRVGRRSKESVDES